VGKHPADRGPTDPVLACGLRESNLHTNVGHSVRHNNGFCQT
jgi:hypothetical protein